MKVAIVIPARLGSTRLPGKMLLARTGRPLIQHTYAAAKSSKVADRVIVATDSAEIHDVVNSFGGIAVMTSPEHASGTDRVAEVAEQLGQFDVIVNLQGDEPELPGASIDLAVRRLMADPQAVMSTLASPLEDWETILDPAVVKVVTDRQGNALYFSRSPIPCPRDGFDPKAVTTQPVWLQHIGLYVYRRDFLGQLSRMPACPLEKIEKLEQLRVLGAGYKIKVAIVEHESAGIDTPEDYDAFVHRVRNANRV